MEGVGRRSCAHFLECIFFLVVAAPCITASPASWPSPWPSSYWSRETIPTLIPSTWRPLVNPSLCMPLCSSSVPVCLLNSAFSSASSPFCKVSSFEPSGDNFVSCQDPDSCTYLLKWWHLLMCCIWYNARDRTAHQQAVWLYLAICLDFPWETSSSLHSTWAVRFSALSFGGKELVPTSSSLHARLHCEQPDPKPKNANWRNVT